MGKGLTVQCRVEDESLWVVNPLNKRTKTDSIWGTSIG